MPIPSDVKLKRGSNILEIRFGETTHQLPAEFLRVHSPSAEVRGHGPNQAQLQYGKINVRLIGLEPQGNYALRLIFDDQHDSGIYSWDYLYDLAQNQQHYWNQYLELLTKQNKTRDPNVSVVKLI